MQCHPYMIFTVLALPHYQLGSCAILRHPWSSVDCYSWFIPSTDVSINARDDGHPDWYLVDTWSFIWKDWKVVDSWLRCYWWSADWVSTKVLMECWSRMSTKGINQHSTTDDLIYMIPTFCSFYYSCCLWKEQNS